MKRVGIWESTVRWQNGHYQSVQQDDGYLGITYSQWQPDYDGITFKAYNYTDYDGITFKAYSNTDYIGISFSLEGD